jgi:TPR repeat protein
LNRESPLWDYYNKTGRDELLELFRKAARQDNPGGQFQLARCYDHGIGVAKDLVAAAFWYRKAVMQGYIPAFAGLAQIYLLGPVELQDRTEAARLFRKAAERGDAVGQCGLGVYQQYFAKDPNDAVKWYELASDQGNLEAKWRLGRCLESGDGTQKNVRKAVQLYLDAAQKGHAGSQYQMGLCFLNGNEVILDPREAVKWFQKASDQGYSSAQVQLGWLYQYSSGLNSYGVYKDAFRACSLYNAAAIQGDSDGQFFLGACVQDGIGCEKNYYKAFEWYGKSAAQNNANGLFALANCYRMGVGVAVDLSEAVKFYRRAAEYGHEKAEKAARELEARN